MRFSSFGGINAYVTLVPPPNGITTTLNRCEEIKKYNSSRIILPEQLRQSFRLVHAILAKLHNPLNDSLLAIHIVSGRFPVSHFLLKEQVPNHLGGVTM